MEYSFIIIPVLIILAFLYSSVGHGGASGYLGMMVLLNVNPSIMKSSALVLNILVSAIATYQFYTAGYFRKNLFVPFIISSIPFTFIGSKISIPDQAYKIILGICLLAAVLRLVINIDTEYPEKKTLPFPIALIIGALIGLISGLIGIGGGILLTPLLLLFKWSDVKEAVVISALFILVNSIAGIIGLSSSGIHLTNEIVLWTGSVAIGGLAGSYWGSHKFNQKILKYILATVLVIAATKLFIN